MIGELLDKIFGSPNVDETIVEIPEWDNAKVLVKRLPLDMGMRFYQKVTSKTVTDDDVVTMVIMVSFDTETRLPLFHEGHREQLKKKSMNTMLKILTASSKLWEA
jgi:hypothetical protein